MNRIKCNNEEFKNIKHGNQIYKIFEEDNLEYLKQYILVNEDDEELEIQITAVNNYSNLENILEVVDINRFGNYSSKEEFIDKMNDLYDIKDNIIVCRVKNLNDNTIDIKDLKLKEMLDLDTLEKLTLGLSGCDVYKTKTINGEDAILKIKKLQGGDRLEDEYNVLEFLAGKVNVAKNFYYNDLDGVEYLLRECIDGLPLYEFKGFGYKLGEELKKFHSLYSEDIKFDKFSVNELQKNLLNKIDIIYPQRGEKFKDYSKEDLKEFLIDYTPEDDSLIHGDFSLTNILNNDETYYYIDLSNLSKSTKYFDLYVLKKSLIINHLEDELKDFLKGYGLDELDENYLDWMSFVELSYS